MIPGIKPSRVRRMLITKSWPHPFSARTPNGGRNTARMNLKMSVHVNAMMKDCHNSQSTGNDRF